MSHSNEPCPRALCRAAGEALQLTAALNPRSIWSTKVLHNIGRGRTARLLDLGVEPRDPVTRARVRGFSKSMRRSRPDFVV